MGCRRYLAEVSRGGLLGTISRWCLLCRRSTFSIWVTLLRFLGDGCLMMLAEHSEGVDGRMEWRVCVILHSLPTAKGADDTESGRWCDEYEWMSSQRYCDDGVVCGFINGGPPIRETVSHISPCESASACGRKGREHSERGGKERKNLPGSHHVMFLLSLYRTSDLLHVVSWIS